MRKSMLKIEIRYSFSRGRRIHEILQVGEEISQAWPFGREVTSEMKRETASERAAARQTDRRKSIAVR